MGQYVRRYCYSCAAVLALSHGHAGRRGDRNAPPAREPPDGRQRRSERGERQGRGGVEAEASTTGTRSRYRGRGTAPGRSGGRGYGPDGPRHRAAARRYATPPGTLLSEETPPRRSSGGGDDRTPPQLRARTAKTVSHVTPPDGRASRHNLDGRASTPIATHHAIHRHARARGHAAPDVGPRSHGRATADGAARLGPAGTGGRGGSGGVGVRAGSTPAPPDEEPGL